MRTIFRPESAILFTGLLWVYIFITLLFFLNRPINSPGFSQFSTTSQQKCVLSVSDYQSTAEIQDIYITNANNFLTVDSDCLFPDITIATITAVHHSIKDIVAYSDVHLKNSPITIRMTASILRV